MINDRVIHWFHNTSDSVNCINRRKWRQRNWPRFNSCRRITYDGDTFQHFTVTVFWLASLNFLLVFCSKVFLVPKRLQTYQGTTLLKLPNAIWLIDNFKSFRFCKVKESCSEANSHPELRIYVFASGLVQPAVYTVKKGYQTW